jgi:hypothetical protein
MYLCPDWAILKEDRKFTFTFDIKKLRHATSHVSSNSWERQIRRFSLMNIIQVLNHYITH